MNHAYGADIAHKVRAFAGDTPIAIAQLVSARLYPSAPTTAQKNDTAAALGGFEGAAKTTFSSTDSTNLVYTVTFDPVDDPDPESTQLWDTWYPVVNVRFKATEDIRALYKPILIWRAAPQFSQMDVDEDDIYGIDSQIETFLGDTITLQKIQAARNWVLKEIKNLGLDRHRLQEYDLSLAVTYKAAQLCFEQMASDENDFGAKAERRKADYEQVWAATTPGYDENDDGIIEPGEEQPLFASIDVFT